MCAFIFTISHLTVVDIVKNGIIRVKQSLYSISIDLFFCPLLMVTCAHHPIKWQSAPNLLADRSFVRGCHTISTDCYFASVLLYVCVSVFMCVCA